MIFKSNLIIITILLLTCSSFAKTTTNSKAKPAEPKQLKILSYFAVEKLSPKARHEYVKALAKTLITLKKEPKDKYSKNIYDLFFGEFTEAHAAEKYLCIGGGVPIPIDSAICGVQTYAGFTCPDGLEICNPLIFGVDKNQKPVCHVTASTSWCFQNTKLGVDHFLEPVFALNNEKSWNELLTSLEEACNNPETTKEDPNKVRSACSYSLRQMIHNQEVKKMLAETYSYKTVDGYGIKAPTPESEAIGAEALKAIEATRDDGTE